MGDYQKAAEYTQRCLTLNPGLTVYASYAAASHAFLGQQKEAEAAWKMFKGYFPEGWIPTTKFLYWGFPFKDYKVFDRYIEGLVKAGFEGDPSDYYKVDKKYKLNGDGIKEIFYGKTATCYDITGTEAFLNFEADGELKFSVPSYGFGDRAKTYIKEDQMCFRFDMLYEGIKWCVDFYANFKENDPAGIQYLMLSDVPMHFLKIQE